ncbi:MAG: hypothetical protein ABL982_18865 [Vicinamibacterales bacterium]
MFQSMRFGRAALGVVLLTAAGVSVASAEVSVAATDATVTMVNGTVNAQFRVAATNPDGADATNLQVTFADGTAVVVGDVPAGTTVASGTETLTFDASGTPTKYQALPVTVTFTVGGQVVQQTGVINLAVQD